MPLTRRSFLALVVPLLSGAGVPAQSAMDCTRATTAAEKAICANPELAKADAAMGTAYAALSQMLPAAQQTALRDDQRHWVKERDAACSEAKDTALAPCLLGETEKRQRFLAGEGANGANGALPLLPAFFNETKKGDYEITVEYPQFAGRTAPKFNQTAHDLALDRKTLSEYREVDPHRAPGAENFYQVGYDITYLDPHLAGVTFAFNAYGGGAHPSSWRSAMLWNPATDEPVKLADFLADPAKAVPAVSAVCADKLSVEAKQEGWDFFANADFVAPVKDVKSWAVDRDGVTIMFNPYSVAAYVVWPRDCRLTYAELGDWLKPGGALPPSAH